MKKRDFLKKAGAGAVATVAAINAPYVHAAKKTTIKWRLQTYAGPALAELAAILAGGSGDLSETQVRGF